MKFNATILLVVGLALVLEPNEAEAQDTKEREGADPVTMLQSDDDGVRTRAQARILQERKNMISQLVTAIDDPENHVYRPYSVKQAMETLGSLRAVEGIDILTEHIGWPGVRHPRAVNDPGRLAMIGELSRTTADRTPAVEALVAIGEPSVAKVIAKLTETESVLEQTSCRAVLRRLDKHVRVREALREAIDRTEDKKIKRTLKSALSEITAE